MSDQMQQQAATSGMLSSMQGGANNKVFSINSFVGSGLNEASVFGALQDSKDAMAGGFGIANMSGLGDMLEKARESQSPLAKMLAAFNKEDGFHAFESWANANKDAIAGKDSPNWKQHEDQQRHADQRAGHEKPFDPNNHVYQGIHGSEARNAAQGMHHGNEYGQGAHGANQHGGYGDGAAHHHENQGHHGHGGGAGGQSYGNSDHAGPGGGGGGSHEQGAPGREGPDNGGRPYGEHEQVGPGGGGDGLQYEYNRKNPPAPAGAGDSPGGEGGAGGKPYGEEEKVGPGGGDDSPVPSPRQLPFSGGNSEYDGETDGENSDGEGDRSKPFRSLQPAAQGFANVATGGADVNMGRLGNLTPGQGAGVGRSVDGPGVGV